MKNNKLFLSMIIVMMMWLVGCPAEPEKEDEKKDDNIPSQPVTNALSSLRKIADGVFTLEYDGDYGLDAMLAAGAKTDAELLALLESQAMTWKTSKTSNHTATINTNGNFACSSIAADHSGDVGGKIFGRNFDWEDSAILLLHTKPYGGYESFSTSCLQFIGINRDWEPSESDILDTATVLGAIYVPMDGMNERGVYISNLQTDDDETTDQDTGKTAITTTVAIRMVLDKADSVDKAIELLQQYDMHSAHNTAHHFAIADNTGKSVVVEWVNNVMYVSDARVVTNHYIAEGSLSHGKVIPAQKDTDDEDTIDRFNTLTGIGDAKNWSLTPEEVRDALNAAKQTDWTVWSAVFEPNARRITYYFRGDYTKSVTVTF